jgi:hypothetical protein
MVDQVLKIVGKILTFFNFEIKLFDGLLSLDFGSWLFIVIFGGKSHITIVFLNEIHFVLSLLVVQLDSLCGLAVVQKPVGEEGDRILGLSSLCVSKTFGDNFTDFMLFQI